MQYVQKLSQPSSILMNARVLSMSAAAEASSNSRGGLSTLRLRRLFSINSSTFSAISALPPVPQIISAPLSFIASLGYACGKQPHNTITALGLSFLHPEISWRAFFTLIPVTAHEFITKISAFSPCLHCSNPFVSKADAIAALSQEFTLHPKVYTAYFIKFHHIF